MAPEELMAGDRQNYIVNFSGSRESPSIGLTAIMGLLILNGESFQMLCYVSTFVSMFITMMAYRYSKDATPKVLLLLFSSQYVLTTLTALKQCYASAFAALAIVLMLQNRKKSKEVVIWTLILLAILFHPTGYILVPLYFLIRYYSDKGKDASKALVPLLLFSVLFIPLLNILSSIISSFVPGLSGKIDEYFGESADDPTSENGLLVIVKGIPFYIITWLGIKWRNKIKAKILFYDDYLLISILCSFLYMMNLYNVWMSRFQFLFQLAVYTFFCLMVRYIPKGARIYNLILLFTVVITIRFLILVGGYF